MLVGHFPSGLVGQALVLGGLIPQSLVGPRDKHAHRSAQWHGPAGALELRAPLAVC